MRRRLFDQMSNRGRISVRRTLGFILLFVMMSGFLVACRGEDEPIPPPQPPTLEEAEPQEEPVNLTAPTAVPTRLVTVTPRPLEPQQPLPILDFEVAPYASDWTLLLRYTLIDGLHGDRFSYSSSATVTITPEGFVFGAGTFQVVVEDRNCLFTLTNPEPFRYTISGTLRSEGDQPVIDLLLLPTNVNYIEVYSRRCFDPLDNRETADEVNFSQLMPLLGAANQMAMSFPLRLASYNDNFEQTLNSPVIQGTVQGEIYFGP